MAKRKTMGSVLRSANRWKARYERDGRMHTPGYTFTDEADAWRWLRSEQTLIDRGAWTPPAKRRAAQQAEEHRSTLTLDTFAREWIDTRTTPRGGPLSPKTRYEYEKYLDGRLADLAALPLVEVDRDKVDAWWLANADAPTMRHHVYAFLSSVMAAAVDRELIPTTPCKVQHAAVRTRQRKHSEVNELITRLSHADVANLVDAMPEHHRALIMLLAYSGLRPQEAFALTRRDVIRDPAPEGIPRYAVNVGKAVGKAGVGPTKTPESNRIVPLPPHLAEPLDEHTDRHAKRGDGGLLFPSTNPAREFGTLAQVMGSYASSKDAQLTGFNAARASIGRPELRIYDLRRWARHTWRQAGVSELEAEQLLGHKLGAVTGAYFTLDRDSLWPRMDAISTAAGWTPDVSLEAPPEPAPASPDFNKQLLHALDPEQLKAVLATMDPEAIAALLR